MSARLFAVLIAVFASSNVAFAQGYSVRVTFNTNLRATYNLQGGIVETVPAGSILQVIGEFNRWLKISRNGNEVWMANWVGHSRVESSIGTQTSAQPASDIDNCCFVDRQCDSDQEWTDGYWAFQNGQCAAPTQSRTQASTQTGSSTPSQIDNCCYAGWQCHSAADWASGFHAFQRNQCEHPGVEIEGSESFVAGFKRAFELLKTRAPQWYDYVIRGLDKVRQDEGRGYTAVHVHLKLMVVDRGDELPPRSDEDHYVRLVLELVHEACHSNFWHAGVWFDEGWRNELPCHEVTLEAILTVDPDSPWIQWDRDIIENYRNHRTWWGAGPHP